MAESNKGNIIPGMRYRDAPEAIDWLCRAFGFSPHLVVPDERGGIAHAQLTRHRHNYAGFSATARGIRRPGQNARRGGRQHAGPYIVIEDIDEHYLQAISAGAEIVYEIADQDYGGRLYTARDPEGFLWNFGSHNPWA